MTNNQPTSSIRQKLGSALSGLWSGLWSDYTKRQRRGSLLCGLAVTLCLVCALTLLQNVEWYRYVENIIQRTWLVQAFRHHESSSTTSFVNKVFSEQTVLVVFDESSLQSGLVWPIERSVYLKLVNKLEKAGATTIAFDIIFSGPSSNPKADHALSQALSHKSVVLPYGLAGQDSDLVATMIYPPLIESWTDQDLATRFGFTQEMPDPVDKRVRLAILKVEQNVADNAEPHYALGVMALAHFLKTTPEEIIQQHSSQLTQVGIFLPGSQHSFTATVGRIAYFGSDLTSSTVAASDLPEAYNQAGQVTLLSQDDELSDVAIPPISDFLQVVPVQDVLNCPDAELPGFFGYSIDKATGKKIPNRVMVLLGVNVPGGHDIKLSEVGPISGPGIHANILWNLSQGTFLKEVGWQGSLLVLLLMATLGTFLATVIEVRWASLATVLAAVGYWFLGFFVLNHGYWSTGGILLPALFPWLALSFCFVACSVYNVRMQKLTKDKMIRLIKETTPIPDPADLLEKRGLEVGSDERILTVLFSDIRGYTDLSENLSPVAITEMLNTYHSAMGKVIERYGGVVFDYQGDAQMVVFGLVPESQPNHAAAACRAGAGMVICLQNLRSEWLAQGRPVFEAGIGISTGPTAIGLLGSSQRKQYAAIGDTTNTSARMQGKSKELNCPVLITESTYEAAGEEIVANYLDSVHVKGKREPIKVYGVDIQKMKDEKGIIG